MKIFTCKKKANLQLLQWENPRLPPPLSEVIQVHIIENI